MPLIIDFDLATYGLTKQEAAGMWTKAQEFHGACGVVIGRNLLGDVPYLLASQHIATCQVCRDKIDGRGGSDD